MLLDLSPGSTPGLHEDSGVQLDFELVILLLKSGGPSAIAGVLDGNWFNAHSLDIKGKPHGMTLELLGFGHKNTWSPAEWISGRVHREPEYRRTYSEYARPLYDVQNRPCFSLIPHRKPGPNMCAEWLRSRRFPLVKGETPIRAFGG